MENEENKKWWHSTGHAKPDAEDAWTEGEESKFHKYSKQHVVGVRDPDQHWTGRTSPNPNHETHSIKGNGGGLDARAWHDETDTGPATAVRAARELGEEVAGGVKKTASGIAGAAKGGIEKIAEKHGDFEDWKAEQKRKWAGAEAAEALKASAAKPGIVTEKPSGIGRHGHQVGRPRGRGRPRGSTNPVYTTVPQGRGLAQYNPGAPLYAGGVGGSLGETGSALSGTLSFLSQYRQPESQQEPQGYDEPEPVMRPRPRIEPVVGIVGFGMMAQPRQQEDQMITFPPGRGSMDMDITGGRLFRGQPLDSGLGLMPRSLMPGADLGLVPRGLGNTDPTLGLIRDRRVDNGNGSAREDDLFGLSIRRPPGVGMDVSGLLWDRSAGNGGKKRRRARR